uniref:TAFII28-like protein domain-containing protein n=1 Tax=Mantoniella antarctica TaxID=81844 RepID=A0A7S0SF62_9CHLO|mmetsp:Transcript_18912/g.46896  ORF Transcript_18912/g.46896 Transcript_18912/m.46896 type:complete len:193 (+) Transcript_18912:86-664(+)
MAGKRSADDSVSLGPAKKQARTSDDQGAEDVNAEADADDKEQEGAGEEEEEEEEVVEDGDEFERRRDRELQEEMRKVDRDKMVELLKHFTPEQMNRYECYRRSSLPKPVLKRLFQTITGTILNPNGLIVLAAVGKLFVGELVEMARQVADEHGVSDLDEIKPAHVQEAHRRLEAEGKMLRERKKALFKSNRM